MAGSSSSDSLLSMNTALHLISNRLTSSNYLLWKNQLLPLLSYQNLLPLVDGTSPAPPSEIITDGKSAPNPEFAAWLSADQRAVILLQASLSEEAFSEIVGLSTAREIWLALEAAYSNSSVERIQNLRDQLRQVSKGSSSVSEFGRKFRTICDQLSAIGHPVEDSDKVHWFLCGLGASFETFSTTIRASRTPLNFRDLLAQAEGHELFMRSIHGSTIPPVAFNVQSNASHFYRGRGRGGRSPRGGRGRGRRSPHCQLCRTNGHYANACPQLARFASSVPGSPVPGLDADLAKAFHAQCHVTSSGPDWYVDSGATDHMSSSTTSVTNPTPFSGSNKVSFGNGMTLPISHTGHTSLNGDIRLRDVLVVPKITKNLLSVSKLTYDNCLDVLFSHPHFYIQDRKTKRVLAQGRCNHGLYVLSTSPQTFFASTKSELKASFELWHARLGHVSYDTISLLNKKGQLSVTSILPKPSLCSSCQMAKAHRLPFVNNDKRAINILDLIHCALWGPSRTQFNTKVKVFQSDGGTEFLNRNVRCLLDNNGTFNRVSCPYTPQQNGRVERKHRHIVETGLAMLFTGHISPTYWVHALAPQSISLIAYHHQCWKIDPRLSYFSKHHRLMLIFDLLGVGSTRTYETMQITNYLHEVSLVFSSGIALVIKTKQTPAHMLALSNFMDEAFDASTLQPSISSPVSNSAPSPPLPTWSCCDDAPVPFVAPASEPAASTDHMHDANPEDPPSASASPVHDSNTEDPPSAPASPIPPSAPPRPIPLPSHPMTTRAKAGIFKPRYRADVASSHGLLAALNASTDPKGFKSAARYPHWMHAMQQELDALRRNNTFTLVPRPVNHNVVGCKWIFWTKYLADGSIDRHKARLVAQGFSQVPGLDYSHTFSPVVKASTVRIVLSLAVTNKWNLHQLDVNNAFLNGRLSELVYMEQPPGFQDPKFPNHVCRLNKALYGLKQAPRACRADPSLFVFKRDSCIMYLLVYVDDLILTGNQATVIQSFINKLHAEFAIKDLGRLSYFLGLEVTYTTNGLFLSQSKYAQDILKRRNMVDAKPVTTPLAANAAFVTSGEPFDDPTTYRSLVGALQYLTITRPDISYAVNQVSQFLQSPTIFHFQSVKRILRYVKGTMSFGLTFSRHKSPSTLLGYSDADWTRCLETRRSTYGYSIFLGGNLVSWSAKKQPTISRSSCESEYRAMANTAAELIWITHLLKELHALPSVRPTLLCDNKSALFLTQNPVSHKHAKHIELDYHFIRELVSSGKLHTKFVSTKLQVADIFTKSLPRHQFEFFRHLLNIGPPPLSLKGDIKHS
ncbi:hypothetical protein OSB04_006670 [Centaurea solstitialis]|uniref:Integrase catalytic domain-containing protein n=1 Tax=Centaurea solstitialis TaxID=347529 RepID=A0AA38TIC4_9ASTR|nr:hypothetical protein OSB04_006670 [Centaurea solstitialis]